ncbi:thiol-disulfide oxidoreductase [Chloropicon primus]|uniref:Thiol-disulfide oxidoreductase n=1 Tax=Chloropicon primus TaxID=1764295 RepID=A0A5B8MMY2_9CHLO|nr:thiol-disulfide oxidoreductase [Chloropicon primus]UPR01136.1 thiol-disulfide oxidoreductase [Chloropicon primus]|mmetsp:Transcript_8421/g.24076  ORF Transcript_8421/g.24076 Transcript_8421/m.24076 type:complete len:401 (+) Transcript_8421:198-1400(+)|eukprot:QDZ21916.1 thiol-disulfide oxidoreductase [Chloropicon primus]
MVEVRAASGRPRGFAGGRRGFRGSRRGAEACRALVRLGLGAREAAGLRLGFGFRRGGKGPAVVAGRLVACSAGRGGEDRGPADQTGSGASTSENDGDPWKATQVATTSGRGNLAFSLVSVAASLGALETAYLSFSKLFAGSVLCPTTGCETILESRYSEILGVPVSVFGFLTYAGVAYLSREAVRREEYRFGVLAGTTVLASVSAFLAYVLFTQFSDETCAWCLASCFFSFSSFSLALWGSSDGDPVKTTVPPFLVSPLIVSALVVLFGDADGSFASEDFELPYKEPVVTTESTREALSLVQKMKLVDAKMYGAFWCSHCFDQKQVFGKEAMKDFPYVECFPSGFKKGIKQEAACEAADVKGFPTWVINGERIEGDQTLEDLEATVNKYLVEKRQDYAFE